jgi:Tfp pilus assembly protein PilF
MRLKIKYKLTLLNLLILFFFIFLIKISFSENTGSVECGASCECFTDKNVPKTAEELVEKGLKYLSQNNQKMAVKSFKKAVSIHPDYQKAHYFLFVSYLYTKDKRSAEKEFNILNKLNPVMAKQVKKIYNY